MSTLPINVGSAGLASGTEATGDIHMPSEANTTPVGGTYPNRADLRAPGTKPIRMPKDGRSPALADKHNVRAPLPPGYHMLPSVSPGSIPAPPGGGVFPHGGGSPGLHPTPEGRFAQAMGAAKASTLGAASSPLSAPSARPKEHVMTGAPAGPGAGPEMLGIGADTSPRGVLAALAYQSSDPDMKALLNPRVPNTPGATISDALNSVTSQNPPL